MVKAGSMFVNWALPLDDKFTKVNVWSKKVKEKGSDIVVTQSSQWLPVSVVPGTIVAAPELITWQGVTVGVDVDVGVGVKVAVGVGVGVGVGLAVAVAVGDGLAERVRDVLVDDLPVAARERVGLAPGHGLVRDEDFIGAPGVTDDVLRAFGVGGRGDLVDPVGRAIDRHV